ncbi:MAG: YraN family protein [Bacteroidetes bacterium]|nr:YraN family protein [Bacteroidota bacterium]MBS1740258.1 YraN family protein [Bacteroidota bacterium]
MSKHNETGVKGEQIAEKFLAEKGYRILHRNWCAGKKEIDIIAQWQDVLVFVEVKTRTSIHFSFPEEAVTPRKQQYLREAAQHYLDTIKNSLKIQFDVVSIYLFQDSVREIVHFEDAF